MKKVFQKIGVLTLLGLTLSACGGTSPAQPSVPVQPPVIGKTSTVTLQLDFPQQTTGLSALAVPSSAASASIKVMQGSTLIAQLNMTKSQTTPTTIKLVQGATYSFETSVKNSAGVEVAWGVTEHKVSTDATVALQVRGIIGSIALSAGPLNGDKQDVFLTVLDPTGASLFGDSEVSYTVTGGTLVEQNKVGAVVRPTPGATTTVTATVNGLGAAHQLQTFTNQLGLTPTQASSFTWQSKFTNWPTDPQLTGRFVNSSNKGLSISGDVNVDGTFTMNFPDVSGILATGGLPFGGTLQPAETQAAYFPLPEIAMGDFIISRSMSLASDYSQGVGLLYVDRDATMKWSNVECGKVGCTSGSTGALTLAKGWNWVSATTNMFTTYYSRPLSPSDKALVSITNVADLGVTLVADKAQAVVGDYVTYTATITRPSNYYASIPFQIELPDALEWTGNVTNATCAAPVVGQNRSVITCTTGGGAVTFQSKARDLQQYPENPSTTRVTLDTSRIYDARLSDNSAAVTLTRVSGGPVMLTPSLDMHLPTLTLQVPAAATVGIPVTVSGTAKDNVAVDRVEIYSGASLIGTVQPDPTAGAWQLSWVPDRTGSHVIRVLAYDLSGNAAFKSVAVSVT